MAFRYAFCNEAFTDWDFARICDYLAEHGYQGVEAAPFTFEQSVFDISAEQRASARQAAANAGLEIVGLHWLLVGPDGLHLTHPDSAVRQRTADYLRGLIAFGHDLNSPYLVFGSPNQRNLPEGVSFEQGMAYATEVFQSVCDEAQQAGTIIAIEPLAPPLCQFITTAAEGADLVRRVNHPNFKLHLDVKAMETAEAEPSADIIRAHVDEFPHFHANDFNLKAPGFGDTDFVPIMRALHETGYDGYVSIEIFEFEPHAEVQAREGIRHLRECAAQVEGS